MNKQSFIWWKNCTGICQRPWITPVSLLETTAFPVFFVLLFGWQWPCITCLKDRRWTESFVHFCNVTLSNFNGLFFYRLSCRGRGTACQAQTFVDPPDVFWWYVTNNFPPWTFLEFYQTICEVSWGGLSKPSGVSFSACSPQRGLFSLWLFLSRPCLAYFLTSVLFHIRGSL